MDEATRATGCAGERASAAEAAEQKADADEAELSEKLNELRLVIATEKQRHENLQAQRRPMAERETELAETIAARRADISMYENKTRAARRGNRANPKRRSKIKPRNASGRKRRENRRATRAPALLPPSPMETKVRAVRQFSQRVAGTSRSRSKFANRKCKCRSIIWSKVQRRYHVDLRAFAPDQTAFEKTLRVQLKTRATTDAPGSAADVRTGGETADRRTNRSCRSRSEDLQKLIADLTRQLDNMGPVNLDAVQEYDELEDRYKFLETQNNDLTNSRRELLDVISQINSTTKKLFAETFAQVRANFREMFAELFGGGRADLSLMDENDPLNCGIEIAAKPPGKQLQSVTLLSGGERAMTAVALLFAIYMVRPSPFCVLDEMDAPLDESNINRFVRVLDRFIGQSQFVIITHNKRTIAKAGVLYGVTMEERGVSKLVGMKLTAPQEAAAQQPANGNGHQEAATQRNFALVAR